MTIRVKENDRTDLTKYIGTRNTVYCVSGRTNQFTINGEIEVTDVRVVEFFENGRITLYCWRTTRSDEIRTSINNTTSVVCDGVYHSPNVDMSHY